MLDGLDGAFEVRRDCPEHQRREEAQLKTAVIVIGTRPEAIKLCPLVRELQSSSILRPIVVATAQHRELLDSALELFDVSPAHDLSVHETGQTLAEVTSRVLLGMREFFAGERPDIVIVQGDTTTTLAASLAAFQERTPVAHVEAGLRSHDRLSPFPEEMNRRLTSQLANLHLAPTSSARDVLVAEGVAASQILITGNTVVDALHWVLERPPPSSSLLADLAADSRRLVLVTTHRRESWGEPLARIGKALATLAREEPDLSIMLPLHPNPVLRRIIEPEVAEAPSVRLLPPQPYEIFVRLMAASHLILTDSGGVQEEAPALGKPVLVLRDTTERPEAVEAGVAELVGTEPEVITRRVRALLHDDDHYAKMAHTQSPFGDGGASKRCRAAIECFLAGSPLPRGLEWGGSFAPRSLVL